MKPLIGITSELSLNRVYFETVLRDGGIPVMLPPLGDPADALPRCDGIILSGGADVAPERYGLTEYDRRIIGFASQERDDYELAMARLAYERDIPTLGICRGIQVINVALGGTLKPDIPGHRQSHERHLPLHTVNLIPCTILREIIGKDTVAVNSIHHQAIDRPAEVLRVSARSDNGITEAAEAPGKRFYMGVQWHPECLPKGAASAMIAALVDAAHR